VGSQAAAHASKESGKGVVVTRYRQIHPNKFERIEDPNTIGLLAPWLVSYAVFCGVLGLIGLGTAFVLGVF